MSKINSGFSFNLKHIKENNSEIWEKHRLMLAFIDEEVEEIHLDELVDAVGSSAAIEFVMDVIPPPLKEAIEGKITEEDYLEKMEKYIIN
jgi:hypothetical protein